VIGFRYVWIALAALLAVSPKVVVARSQEPRVVGTVRDQSGELLPGATITLTPRAAGPTATTVSTGEGRFDIAAPAGTYELRVEMDGFALHSSTLTLATGTITRDVSLSVPVYADTVVVTGTRTPEALRAAPVALSVVRETDLQTTPASHYGELLRPTAGVNTIELSARDIQIATRTAAGRNARTTLALVDGRTIYQDYFGMVLWDLVPISFDEIKQVEVLRGPGSALWGANALTGVVNVLTKSPQELRGTRGRIGVGSRGSNEVGLVHAGTRGRVGYKLSGSLYSQDAWERPETLPDGTVLPPYTSKGTNQYKLDARVDVGRPGGQRWRFDGGLAGSSGLILVAVGPYDARTLRQGYASVEYSRGSRSISGVFTAHQSNYAGLLGPDTSDISSQFVQLDARDARTIGRRHLLLFGGTFKHSHFDLSFVPDVHRREEAGAFVTDDIFLTDQLRVTAGARIDWFNTFGAFVSPRVGVRYSFAPEHTVRATYNRAYVAPSLVESFSNFSSTIEIPLPTGPFALPTVIRGQSTLEPQTIDAFEVGYTAVVHPVSVTASWYRNATDGLIQLPITELYSPADPPPGWPLPREVLAGLPLPKTFVWSSVGNIDESGLELSIDTPVARGVAVAATYSFQATPDVEPVTAAAVPVNIPPRHRANARVSVDRRRFVGTAGVTYTDRAFWTDVLAFQGWTDSFWLVDATAGVRFNSGRLTLLVRGTNLADRRIQHHIFGDLIRRRVMTELRFKL
jgi:outer membrane receptor protein involved in Fe transport